MNVDVLQRHRRLASVALVPAVLAILALPVSRVSADETEDNVPARPAITAKIRVEDPQGNPIPDAVVRAFGMRTKAQRGSHYGWVPERHGEPSTGKTDVEGQIELAVPKFVQEELETGEVTWTVSHPDYVKARLDLHVDADPGVVKLAHGRRIIANAVHRDTGEPIQKNLYGMISGDSFYDEWKSLRDGKIMSGTVSYDRPLLRLVHLPDNGPALFSQPIDLRKRNHSRRTVIPDVRMSPVTRVTGKLADNVPRPVVDGYVAVDSVLHAGIKDREQQLTWSHWVPIERDGSFVIESLPPDSIGQFIAVCDGWLSAPTPPEHLDKVGLGEFRGRHSESRITPDVLHITGPEVSCVLPMMKTTSCRVTVQSADGMPIADAEVSMWPNQIWYGGGSRVVGTATRNDLVFKLTPEERSLLSEWSERTHQFRAEKGMTQTLREIYIQTTDEHGIAVIQQLPCGSEDQPRNEGVHVRHDEYEQPPANNRRRASVELIRGQIAEITVTMDPVGTTVLGR